LPRPRAARAHAAKGAPSTRRVLPAALRWRSNIAGLRRPLAEAGSVALPRWVYSAARTHWLHRDETGRTQSWPGCLRRKSADFRVTVSDVSLEPPLGTHDAS